MSKKKIFNISYTGLLLLALLWDYTSLWQFAGTAAVFMAVTGLNQTPKFQKVVLRVIYVGSLFGVMSLISIFAMKLFVGVLGVYLYYFYNSFFSKAMPVFLDELMTVSAAFMGLVFLWGIDFFFTPAWWIVILVSAMVAFVLLKQPIGLVGALVGALVVGEMAWAALYLPVHFLTSAILTFAVFYLVYMLSGLYFEGRINRKKVYFQIGVVGIAVVLSMLSSPWKPL